MKVHHLNCGTLRVYKREGATAVCHCLLIETDDSLVLVDSGIGTDDMMNPARLGLMHLLLNLRIDESQTALYQIERLGFSARDVKHIIITHLDLDHTGGIPDFPEAQIHVPGVERAAAMNPSSFREHNRYRTEHLDKVRVWASYDRPSPEPWFGFECIRKLQGLPEDIVMVMLPGHTRGHCGIALKMDGRWLLHAGDSYYHHDQMAPKPRCPLQFSAFQLFAHMDYTLAMRTKRRLWSLVRRHPEEVEVFCSHDPRELARYAVRA